MTPEHLVEGLIVASDRVIDTGRRLRSDPGNHELALGGLCSVMARIAVFEQSSDCDTGTSDG